MFGKVLRPAGFNATLVSLDTTAAEKMPAIQIVRDGDFVGVVAEDPWICGAGALRHAGEVECACANLES